MKPKKPTKDDFATLLMDRIRQAGEKSKLVYNPEAYLLRGEAEHSTTIYLDDAYQEYCAAPEDVREKIIKVWVRGWFSYRRGLPDDFADAKPDLMPDVRSRSHFELTSLQSKVEDDKPANWSYQVLGEHFGVGLVYDLPDGMRSLSQEDLDSWGVSFNEALEIAKKNLLALPVKFRGPQSGEGRFVLATGDSYDASRSVFTDSIRCLPVKGDHIAMIPNRDSLIVAGSEDVEGLLGMVKLAKKAVDEPRPISGIALRLDNDARTPWLPPSSHLSYKEFQVLRLRSFVTGYSEQKELLEQLHKKEGEDVFIAPFIVAQSSDGTVFSYVEWNGNAASLLPETDMVGLQRGDGISAMVAYHTLLEEMGDRVESPDIYPPRYRLLECPSQDQFARMGDTMP